MAAFCLANQHYCGSMQKRLDIYFSNVFNHQYKCHKYYNLIKNTLQND